MSNKSNDLNPQNEKFNNYQEQAKTIASRQAQNIYKDKPFAEEWQPVFISASALRFVANIVSASTLLIASYLVFNTLLGFYLAIAIGLAFCVLFEVLKSYSWRIISKQILKYKRISLVAVVVLVGLHLVSLGGSCVGAWYLPRILETPTAAATTIQNVDSINKSYLVQQATINGQLLALQDKTASSTIRRTIKQLTNQKSKILEAQNLAIKDAKALNKVNTQERKENARKANFKRNEDIRSSQVACVVGAIFFELLFVLCSFFISYFLFRQFVDDVEDNQASTHLSTDSEISIKTTSGAEAAPRVEAKKIGFEQNAENQEVNGKGLEENDKSNSKKLEFTKVCKLDTCKSKFIHNVHNQLFCSKKCKMKSYNRKKGNQKTKEDS